MLFPSTSIGVSSWTWHNPFYKGELSLIEIPARAHAAGLSQVELNDFMLPPGRWSRTRKLFRHLFRYKKRSPKQQRYLQSTIADLIHQLNKYQINCISWSIESDLTVSDENWAKEFTYIVKGIHTAAQLNASMLRLTLGGSDQMEPDIDRRVIHRLKLVSTSCHKICPTIQPIVENHWGISTDIGRFLRIVEAVPDVGICFDPANIPIEIHEAAWKKLAAKADLFHLKVIDHHPNKLDQNIDYHTIFQHLVTNRYAGPLIIEYEGDDKPAEALDSILSQLKMWPSINDFDTSKGIKNNTVAPSS